MRAMSLLIFLNSEPNGSVIVLDNKHKLDMLLVDLPML